MTDQVLRYDPATATWTRFDLPTRGTESRHVSLHQDGEGRLQVVVPYYRSRKIAVMTLRTERDLESLKARAAR
jgi:hypothetical protein